MHILLSGSGRMTRSCRRSSRSAGESCEIDAIVELQIERVRRIEAAMEGVGCRPAAAVRALGGGARSAAALDLAAAKLVAERMVPGAQERLAQDVAEIHVLAQIGTADRVAEGIDARHLPAAIGVARMPRLHHSEAGCRAQCAEGQRHLGERKRELPPLRLDMPERVETQDTYRRHAERARKIAIGL